MSATSKRGPKRRSRADRLETTTEKPVSPKPSRPLTLWSSDRLGSVVTLPASLVAETNLPRKTLSTAVIPALVVASTSVGRGDLRYGTATDDTGQRSLIVRSFFDDSFNVVDVSEIRPFRRRTALLNMDKRLAAALERAVNYMDKKILPEGWNREDLLSTKPSSQTAAVEASSPSTTVTTAWPQATGVKRGRGRPRLSKPAEQPPTDKATFSSTNLPVCSAATKSASSVTSSNGSVGSSLGIDGSGKTRTRRTSSDGGQDGSELSTDVAGGIGSLLTGFLPPSQPEHSFPVPDHVKLVSIKDMIYRPDLPSFRGMDRDNTLHRLSDEHCRTASALSREDFLKTSQDLRRPNQYYRSQTTVSLPSFKSQLEKNTTRPDVLNRARQQWSSFLCRTPERMNISLPSMPAHSNFHYTGYAIRYVQPELNKQWTYKLKARPHVDSYHQVTPVPIELIDVHRGTRTFPSESKTISSAPWKPPTKNYYRFA